MFTSIYKNIILIFLLALVTACGGGGGSLPGAAPGSSPGATANPSVRILGNNANIIISFGKTMDIGTLSVTGSLSGEVNSPPVWSTNRVNNDTLVISPTSSWVLGSSRTINVSANELGGSGQIILSLVYDVYAGTGFFVSNDNGDDMANGQTPANATKTITAAITLASANTPAWIVVDGGNYPVTYGAAGNASHVILTNNISLYGGYNADFTDRDTGMYTSTITNSSASYVGDRYSANTAIEMGNGVTASTIVDGFTINATTQPGLWFTSAILVSDGGSPTIQNNILNAGTGTFPYGILSARNASPTIYKNLVYGGTATNNSYGIYSFDNSNPTISHNSISGGSGVNWSIAVYTDTASAALIYNNVISAGDASNTSGIVVSSSSPVIQNNTINGGNGTTTVNAVLIQSAGAGTPLPSPRIENNIIFTTFVSGDASCFGEYAGAARPASLRNNNLSSCPKSVYWGQAGICPGNADGDNNGATCTVAELEAYVGANGSGNTVADMSLYFVDIDGPDNNILTTNDNNWRLQSFTPASVRNGGLNGIDDGGPGWGFTNDLAGKVRPASGAPWSIGAYEP